MNYCNQCGNTVTYRIPDEVDGIQDDRKRFVCDSCGVIHYVNPKIVAGCIPIYQDQILLCKRAIEPRYGMWTIPAGFMECNETTAAAAQRETVEEANANVEIKSLYCYVDIPDVSQIYVIFIAQLLDLDFHPGQESLQTQLFEFERIPWEEIAFPSVKISLEYFVKDHPNRSYPLHIETVYRRLQI